MGTSKHDSRQVQPSENSCVACTAEAFGPFCKSSSKTIQKMDQGRAFGRYQAGQILYQEGNPAQGVFCVKKGLVKMSRLGQQGVEHILATAGPGSLIGMMPYLQGGNLDHSAVAATPLEVCHVTDKSFREGLDSDPALLKSVAEYLANELSELRERWMDRSEGTISDRLMTMLNDLPREAGNTVHSVSIPLSRKELGSYLGAAPETVMRALKKLSAEGRILVRGREIVLIASNNGETH